MSKSTLGKITNYFPLEISFELDFCIDGAKVYTTDNIPNLEGVSSESDSASVSYLAVETWTQLDPIDSWLDGQRYIRPVILTLLSIISYLLDHPLTVYQAPFNVAKSASDEKPNKVEVSRFIHNQIDKSSDLLKILEAVYLKGEDVKQFVVSALSRWHKARYFEEESYANLYDEESFLTYFHIMELFSNHYSTQQSNEAQNQIKNFIRELLANTLCAIINETTLPEKLV